MENWDFFDRIMEWPILSPLHLFYKKYKEPLLYLFFGGLTFILGIGLFWVFTVPAGMNALSANGVDWIICIFFAYLTNRTWVFKEKARDKKGVLREFFSFVIGRLGTLALEEIILWFGIDILQIDSIIVKITAQVFVIAGNYIISKFFVFKQSAVS